MAGPKRSLAPRFDPQVGRQTRCRPAPLREGFAIPRERKIPIRDSGPGDSSERGANPRPYGRGSAAEAMAHMDDPSKCLEVLRIDIVSSTTAGPAASRRKLWAELAIKAGAQDPFELDPTLMFKVMGALKLAGFRSAQLYLDTAKAVHISSGHPWTAHSFNRPIGLLSEAAPGDWAHRSRLRPCL